MPKENTHLYFSKNINKVNMPYTGIINQNINYYYLGSVTPDTFYYSKNIDIQKVSDVIHGKYGQPTNELIFDLLDLAKKNNDEKILSFTMGFITHCYLDIIFHPIIFYLTGNFYDENLTRREEAIFRHRRLEVTIDQKLNKDSYFENLIDKKIFKDINFIEILSNSFNIPPEDVELSFERQYVLNKIFHKKYYLNILYFLNKIGILNRKSEVSLFYGNLKNDYILNDNIEYRDLFNGEAFSVSLSELFDKANLKTKLALGSAYKYYKGEESRIQAIVNISGENLDTGSKTYSVDDIKFFINN